MSLFMRADATVMLGAALFSLFTLDPVFTLVWSASGVTSLVLARHMERSDFEARQARVAWSRQ
ncbi:MAG TPA: hypothetical protein VJS20_03585 [Gemmatimonadales bacterium]|nr:hypothetical protein [Gemmatimonadales bacterium]